MREPEVALVFTADVWVEELHRHLTDHGGARVRTLVVEPEGVLDESYDVLVTGHRWPALTRALVADVHAHGRAVMGVHDRAEPASRKHLLALGVDSLIESDAGPDAFTRAIVAVAGARDERPASAPAVLEERLGQLVVVGGPPGSGRTEIAVRLAIAFANHRTAALVDADDVAPAVAQRLGLPIEPNLRTAIDAVEHGVGTLDHCLFEPTPGARVVTGLPNAAAWSQVRPGEVIRVIDRVADHVDVVVADGAGSLEELSDATTRGRYATARALVTEADAIVAVCDASPHGVARLLTWIVEARTLAPVTPMIVIANRAPAERFRRGELFEEITTSAPVLDVVFVPHDSRVMHAAWHGVPVDRGPFVRALAPVAERLLTLPRRAGASITLEARVMTTRTDAYDVIRRDALDRCRAKAPAAGATDRRSARRDRAGGRRLPAPGAAR